MTSRIFCAIDTADLGQAKKLVSALQGHVAGIKLGLEFFTAHGPQGYKEIATCGLPIFLDLKLHDIPNTVAHALAALKPLQPQFVTLHSSGGPAMMRAAADAVKGTSIKLLAVTVLTSLGVSDLQAVGQHANPAEQVVRLAKLAKESGMDGIVCAPTEVALVREACGPDFILMVPGIRPAGAALGDQKRVMTPREAVAAGATYMVIGRPITENENPATAATNINAECL